MHNKLKVLFWNARGIKNKFQELVEYIERENIDIIGINETFLTDTVLLPMKLTIQVGGLLLLVKITIDNLSINSPNTELFECITVQIKADRPFNIFLIYCPGGSQRTNLIKTAFTPEITAFLNQPLPVIIMGEFNAKHRSWNCPRNNTAGQLLKDLIDNSRIFMSFPADPTYNPVSTIMTPSTIDLAISDGIITHSVPETIHKFTSDHYPVMFEIFSAYNPLSGGESEYLNYSQAHWNKFKTELSLRLSPIYDHMRHAESILHSIFLKLWCTPFLL